MQVDIGQYIGALLYTHDTVSIPGLGSFVSDYQASTVDPVQGELAPPAKAIKFNRNLSIDDGLLVNYISQQEKISQQEASQLLSAYIDKIKGAIEEREIVSFSGLGRLYKDYEGHYQFLADGTNFNTDSYGLPNVKYFPVAKAGSYIKATIPDSDHKKIATSAFADRFSGVLNNSLAIAIGVAAIVILVAAYFLFFRGNGLSDKEATVTVPTSRVNVRPGIDDTADYEEDTGEMPADETPLPSSEGPGIEGDPEETIDTEEPTIAPEQDYFVIIIGSFGNEENVQRLVQKIYQAGYEPYTEAYGKLTKVGIQKTYTEKSEIERVLKDIRKHFNKNARVYKE
ncbi:MAG: HU family DNA-binding protein [Chitinophagales bacterium]|nr:HU family DNA-binding protein [Chitinophagales bacterium]